MLKSIKVENYKKLENFEAEFSVGLNIIHGENFAGKTTLIEAISFAFFGVKASAGKAEDIPTWGHSDCKVTLKVGQYTIIRSLKNCKVFDGDTIAANGSRVCGEFIQSKILKSDLKTFRMVNWADQGEVTATLTIGATELQRNVERLSGVEFIDKMVSMVNDDLRLLYRDVELLNVSKSESQLTKEISELSSKIVCDSLEVKKYMEKEVTIAADIDTVKNMINVRKSAMEKRDEKLKKVESLSSKAAGILKGVAVHVDPIIKKLSKSIKDSPAVDVQALDSMDKEISQEVDLFNRREQLIKDISRFSGEAGKAKSFIAKDRELEEAVNLAKEKLSESSNEFLYAEEAVSLLDEEIHTVRQEIDSGVCSKCGQLLDISEEDMVKMKGELQDLKASREPAIKRLYDAKVEFKSCKRELSQAEDDMHSNHGDWKSKYKFNLDNAQQAELELGKLAECRSEGEITADVEKIEALRASAVSLEKDKKELARLLEVKSSELNEAEELSEKADSIQKTLPEEVSKREFNQLQGELDDAQLKLRGIVDKRWKLDSEVKDMRVDLKVLEADLKTVRKVLKTSARIALVKKFLKFLKTSRADFIRSVWETLSSSASEFLTTATEGAITQLSRSVSGDFTFYESGRSAPITAASGAQKAFIGLSLRLALQECIPDTAPVMILDEPTESMSEKYSMLLTSALLGRSQVLMITHRASDSLTADNIIEV